MPGVVIPYDYARDLQRGRPATVQFLLNAMNANTATIAQGLRGGRDSILQPAASPARAFMRTSSRWRRSDVSHRGLVYLHPAYLFNPGLVASWFIVTGVFGLLLILNGSIVAPRRRW